METTVHYVLSFGAFCLTAKTLTDAGMRAFAAPLDWVFSSPAMIAHCVGDDWRAFLDPEQYMEHAGLDPHVGHRLYSKMAKKAKIFLHRSPLVPEEYAYYTRCVDRMRAISTDKTANTLFVLLQSSKHRSPHTAWARQFAALFDALDVHWRGRFELLVVRLQYGKSSIAVEREAEAHTSTRGNTLRLVYLRCIAPHSAASFGDIHDRKAFCDIVHANRRFALRPDPLHKLTPGARAAVSGGAPPRVRVPAADAAAGDPSKALALGADLAPRREGERSELKALKAARAAAHASQRAAVSPKQKLSKAERRARQEAERAAKAFRCLRTKVSAGSTPTRVEVERKKKERL
jgi:hypothetical protein